MGSIGRLGSEPRQTVIENTYHIEVKASPGTDRVALGRELSQAIATYERAHGRGIRR